MELTQDFGVGSVHSAVRELFSYCFQFVSILWCSCVDHVTYQVASVDRETVILTFATGGVLPGLLPVRRLCSHDEC
jgi:hypothetical protein